MTERLLQFIWQFQYFNKAGLAIVSGELVQITFPGQLNQNQGPDFLNAKIKIDNTQWVGSIEIHVTTSDWGKHNHSNDKNYDNVILHVVWENDAAQNNIPVLELQPLVSKVLLSRYEELMMTKSFIACEKMVHQVKDLIWKGWKDRLLAERLMRKANIINNYLQQNNHHWEETFWWLLAKNFGMKVNADAFEAIAQSISINILAKHKHQIHQLEAMLLGQAGLLNQQFEEEYPRLLQREYKFLNAKYNFNKVHLPMQFLRMRPGNFPSLRLAQLAMLTFKSAHLFSQVREANELTDLHLLLNVTANDYWHYHYRFDELTAFKEKRLGNMMIDHIIINCIVPMLFAYGNYHNNLTYKEKALHWLEQCTAEKNAITKGFAALHVAPKNAFDSQALIELKNEYCSLKKCLDCSVGNALLKTNN